MISAPLRVPAPNGAVRFIPSSSSSRSTRIRCFAAPPGTGTGRGGASTTTALYKELGLRAGATVREIKAAYRRLARERHPDVAGGAAAADFVRLHHAYATLSDPDSRARHDYDRRWPRYGSSGYGRPRRNWESDQCW